MDKEHKSLPLEKIDMQVISVEPCNIDEVKKSFAGLSEKEDLHLDPDLMYARFIMCHEGDNANGDYFTKEVLQQAQYTPRFKPIDWEHGQPMIGTILDSHYAEDATGRGYIEAVGVIWKFIYPELAEQVKTKSATGELRLSMECYFKDANYKYGEQIFDQQQAEELGIAEYHGREYMGHKVYRVFKSVVFGGVGVVANPADKEAVFLAVAKKQAQEVIQNNEIVDGLSEEQIQAIAQIIRNTNDFREKEISRDTVDAITVAKFVKAFDKAKSNIVSRFNKDTIVTKEQLVSEVTGIINDLLADVSNINNDYFVGRASEDSPEGESELAGIDLNLKLCDPNELTKVADEDKGGSETMEIIENQEVVVENVEEAETQTVESTEETTEEVAVAEPVATEETTEVVDTEVETVDYEAKASVLETQVAELEGKLQEKDTAIASLTEEFNALKNKVEAKEQEETLNTRIAELNELGVELSEARKQKEIEKISAMDGAAFADYKEFLAELVGKKVEVVQATEEVVDTVEEVEVQVENTEQATAGLNIETEQPKVIKPFGHLAE